MNTFRKAGILFLAFIMVMMVIFFATRNFFLKMVVDHFSARLRDNYHAELSLSAIQFSGFTGVSIQHLVLMPQDGDILLKIDSMYVQPSFFPLFIGRLKLKEAYVRNGLLNLTCGNNGCNYDSFLRGQKNEQQKTVSEKNYSSALNRMIRLMFDLTPQKASFQNLSISYSKDNRREQVNIPIFISSDRTVNGTLLNLSDGSRFYLDGVFSQNKRTFDFKIYPWEFSRTRVPILKLFANTDCRFDTLHCVLSKYEHASNLVSLAGTLSTDNFYILHPKISDELIGIHHADFSFAVNVGKENFELDSLSMLTLNQLVIHPYLNYKNASSKKYILKIQTNALPATDFFSSLPVGMFDAVTGIKAEGSLRYSLDLSLDSSQPDSVIFNSSLVKENFRIKRFGKEDLLKLNDNFLYSVYEHEKFVRSFMVDFSNPDFTPLDHISPYFRNAVMTSEDGSFFFHSGFNEDAFRKSIAANYKAGKFVRGGSTITMQLVKNVFLTRHKTVSRKAEEALIVWLIENNHLCSKERMLEVYLNIIELGPNIYGIGEASRFYFSKKPAELNLAESVFLASLLPRPKWFKYSFDESGNLKPYFADYYRVVANFLLKKNLITQEEYDHLQPRIELRGPAKNFVTPADSLPVMDEPETE